MREQILSLVSGPLLGGLFGCVNAYLANKEKQDKRKHELDVMREERETRLAEAQIQLNMTQEKFAGESFVKSQEYGNKTALGSDVVNSLLKGGWFMRTIGGILAILLGLTDVARQCIRPGITIYLAIVCTNMLKQAMTTVGGMTIQMQQEIAKGGIQQQFNLLSMVVAWWFGDRMTNKMLDRK